MRRHLKFSVHAGCLYYYLIVSLSQSEVSEPLFYHAQQITDLLGTHTDIIGNKQSKQFSTRNHANETQIA